MCKTIILPRYRMKNIALLAFGLATVASLFFLVSARLWLSQLADTSLTIASALLFALALSGHAVINLVALRHITSARFNGSEFWIWGGRDRPLAVHLLNLVSLAGGLGAVSAFCFGSILGWGVLCGSFVIALVHEESCRLNRFKRRIPICDIVSAKTRKRRIDVVTCVLTGRQLIRLPYVKELEPLLKGS